MLYSRFPAQFVSLFFDAQANRGETTRLAIIPAKNLIKVRLFMAMAEWATRISLLWLPKRGDCTPIANSFGATKKVKASGQKDDSDTNRQRLFQKRSYSERTVSFDDLGIKRRCNLDPRATFSLEVGVKKGAQAVRCHRKLAASVDSNNS